MSASTRSSAPERCGLPGGVDIDATLLAENGGLARLCSLEVSPQLVWGVGPMDGAERRTMLAGGVRVFRTWCSDLSRIRLLAIAVRLRF